MAVTSLPVRAEAVRERLEWLEQVATQSGRRLLAGGALWALLAIVALCLASVVTWTVIPLVSSTTSWTTPVDIGWGLRSGLWSYGTLTVLIALLCGVRLLATRPWRIRWRGAEWEHDPVALRPRSLVIMGAAAALVSLLYVYQFVYVDFAHVAVQAKQESESLLVRHHLNYTLPSQTVPMSAFNVGTANIGDRLLLLIQLVSPGLLLPILAGLLCFYGAFLLRRAGGYPLESGYTERALAWLFAWADTRWGRRRRVFACGIALGALAALLLGRAPLALIFERGGQQAVQDGTYQNALTDFRWAYELNPALNELPNFHQQRGQALAMLHSAPDVDIQLYLAQQDRQSGALDQAWLVDSLLFKLYPHDTFVVRDTALTAEMEMERSLGGVALPTDPETAQQNPRYATLPLGKALLWANRLLAIQTNNLAGHYVRGRVLFTMRQYEVAATDFQTIVDVSSDNDMQSAAYTYLAFCRGALGDLAGERLLLRKAIKLDYGYNNTTAREAASGLH